MYDVALERQNGDEPDGDLHDVEFNDAVSIFRVVLDQELREAGIELTLGTVLAPQRYYQR